jgi:hypothetical protein
MVIFSTTAKKKILILHEADSHIRMITAMLRRKILLLSEIMSGITDMTMNKKELFLMNYIHILRLYINYFQPMMKLRMKQRIGSKIIKRYDEPKTPYQRIIDIKDVSKNTKNKLKQTYQTLNPFELKSEQEKSLEI